MLQRNFDYETLAKSLLNIEMKIMQFQDEHNYSIDWSKIIENQRQKYCFVQNLFTIFRKETLFLLEFISAMKIKPLPSKGPMHLRHELFKYQHGEFKGTNSRQYDAFARLFLRNLEDFYELVTGELTDFYSSAYLETAVRAFLTQEFKPVFEDDIADREIKLSQKIKACASCLFQIELDKITG